MKKFIALTIILVTLAACTLIQSESELPNPASIYCEQNGGKLEIVTMGDGSQSGRCVFPDGTACDEWAYYRKECGPVTPVSTIPAADVQATLEEASGGFIRPDATEDVADWWGIIKSTEQGAQFDDYFERQDLGQIIYFGIDSTDPAVKSQIDALRDSGRIVHLYGTLISNVPDYNGSQIQVNRIEVEK